jgi:hypothetical protein
MSEKKVFFSIKNAFFFLSFENAKELMDTLLYESILFYVVLNLYENRFYGKKDHHSQWFQLLFAHQNDWATRIHSTATTIVLKHLTNLVAVLVFSMFKYIGGTSLLYYEFWCEMLVRNLWSWTMFTEFYYYSKGHWLDVTEMYEQNSSEYRNTWRLVWPTYIQISLAFLLASLRVFISVWWAAKYLATTFTWITGCTIFTHLVLVLYAGMVTFRALVYIFTTNDPSRRKKVLIV